MKKALNCFILQVIEEKEESSKQELMKIKDNELVILLKDKRVKEHNNINVKKDKLDLGQPIIFGSSKMISLFRRLKLKRISI